MLCYSPSAERNLTHFFLILEPVSKLVHWSNCLIVHLRRKWKRKKVHVFRCQKGYTFLKRELFYSITWCTSCIHRCRSSGESNWILLNSDVSIDSLDALHLHWLPLNSIDEDRNHHHPLDMNLGKASDSNVNKHLLKNPTFPPVASFISMWYKIRRIHLI